MRTLGKTATSERRTATRLNGFSVKPLATANPLRIEYASADGVVLVIGRESQRPIRCASSMPPRQVAESVAFEGVATANPLRIGKVVSASMHFTTPETIARSVSAL